MDYEALQENLNSLTNTMSSSMGMDMTELVTYNIFGAAVTATRAFEKVSIKLDANASRIYVSIKLRWWARHSGFERLHDVWLKRAEVRCAASVPTGWSAFIYYEKGVRDAK